MMFALYVQFHGDYGPGGGFQAVVIFGSAFILHGLLSGVEEVKRVVAEGTVRTLAATGVLVYAGVGVASLLFGGNYLDYNVLSDDPVAGQHLGIMIIELGVGITVAATMISLFFAFGSRD
jgi:multicomponent Na+:H+ antiporter subunit B